MPSNLPRLTLRTSQETIAKIQHIANTEKRTTNKQVEKILEDYIKQYESINGNINIRDINITGDNNKIKIHTNK